MLVQGPRSCLRKVRLLRQSASRATLALALASGCAAPALAQSSGQQVFMSNGCFACHGQTGTGGVGPSFRGDHFLAVTDYVIAQILLGRGVMPSFAGKLNDQQIAAVASYVRNSWGNNFGEVKPEQVARVRKEVQPGQNQVGSSQPSQGSGATQPAGAEK